uniref:Serpentine receptor class gamma n=1 Tax=Caenorhabditis tropicalis TaxID=1561998 RepID=A0A1I7T5T2_9PELO
MLRAVRKFCHNCICCLCIPIFCILAPFRPIWKFLNNKFTKFSLAVDAIVQDRNLLSVPENVWLYFCYSVYFNFGCALITFIGGVLCFTLGLYSSTFYTRVNCDNGLNIWIPLNNLVATWTGFFAVKTLHIRWSAFVHLVFTATMTPLMMIAAIYATAQVPVWYAEQRMSRGGKNWGYWNASGNIALAVCSYTIVCLSIFQLAVYYKYWLPSGQIGRFRSV